MASASAQPEKYVVCQGCDQWNDPQYDTCWNCDKPLEKAAS